MEVDLKNNGLKITLQRRKILAALENSPNKHVSAEELHALLKNNGEEVSLATVYRVLTQFVLAGIVIKHNFEDQCAVFELANKAHHDHLICLQCGVIIEFYDQVIEEQQIKITQKYNFTLIDHSLSLYGKCADCTK